MKKNKLIILILFSFLLLSLYYEKEPDIDRRIEKIENSLNKFDRYYPQQKVYLHLDKTLYHSNETIWFKAYLLNGMNHHPDSISTNLYVELINPKKIVVQIIRLRMTFGFGRGEFLLTDTVPEGLYQIRAYTNWMKNFDTDYYFSQNLSVRNPHEINFISNKEAKRNRKSLRKTAEKANDIEFTFFPEGGNLVAGLSSVLAFKAINETGGSLDAYGKIYDSKGNEITSFQSYHDGMGTVAFTPEKDKKYYATVNYKKHKKIKVDLPEILPSGIVMKIDNSDPENIFLTLSSNRPPTNDRMANEVVLTGQVRDKMYYTSIEDLSNNRVVKLLNKSIFPTGILQLTVFNSRGIPLSERLVFINHDDQLNIATATTIDSGKVHLSLKITDKDDKPVKSNISLSVLPEDTTKDLFQEPSMLANLLLTSDLKGYIDNPEYYFQDSPGAAKALDDLLLTQGWRRFDWNKIVNSDFPGIRYLPENKITVEGQITRELLGFPFKNADVTLSILDKYNDVFSQKSGYKGHFKFEGLDYQDTISVRITVRKPNNKKNLLILLAESPYEKITKYQGNLFLTTVSERDKKEYRHEKYIEFKKEEAIKDEEDKKEHENDLPTIHGKPDNVIYGKDIPDGTPNILEAIKGRVPGVLVTGNSVVIRGPSTLLGSNDPLILVDGVPTFGTDALFNIPPQDVERIEFLKGPSAAIYGIRGANGVIAIYTKRGRYMIKGQIEFQMLGFHTPREFYQPRYSHMPEKEMNKLSYSTVFWAPDIKSSENGKANVIFAKPPGINNFRIIVEGISNDGKIASKNFVAKIN
jgi:TonB-dependent SusC/RagA subfamily outer membrane receptor